MHSSKDDHNEDNVKQEQVKRINNFKIQNKEHEDHETNILESHGNQGYPAVKVYPNPTTGKVNVTCSDLFTEYEIKNLQGQTIIIDEIKGGKIDFNLSKYKSGMFLLILKSSNTRHVEKISVIK